MARTKKVDTTAITSEENEVVAEEKTVETEEKLEVKLEVKLEETQEEIKEEQKVETVKTEKLPEVVWIQNPMSAYKRIRVCREVYPFDSEGKALVSKEDAILFLKQPGYSVVK